GDGLCRGGRAGRWPLVVSRNAKRRPLPPPPPRSGEGEKGRRAFPPSLRGKGGRGVRSPLPGYPLRLRVLSSPSSDHREGAPMWIDRMVRWLLPRQDRFFTLLEE